jgi:hypothetical protein
MTLAAKVPSLIWIRLNLFIQQEKCFKKFTCHIRHTKVTIIIICQTLEVMKLVAALLMEVLTTECMNMVLLLVVWRIGFDNGVEGKQRFMISNGGDFNGWIKNPLDYYGLEEIKQLISIGNCNNNLLFDEHKTEETLQTQYYILTLTVGKIRKKK